MIPASEAVHRAASLRVADIFFGQLISPQLGFATWVL